MWAIAQSITGKVIGVSDGDTIKVLYQDTQIKIRLYGIDAPEKNQDFGTKAKLFASHLVFGKDVTVRLIKKERYGRMIGEVWLLDGRSLNQELVKEGYAWWYKSFAPKDKELERLQAEARTAKKGLWVQPNPVPPWEFRKD